MMRQTERGQQILVVIMTPRPKSSYVAIGTKRRKLLIQTPKPINARPKPSTSILGSKQGSHISPRHLWRSSAHRAQHHWQVTAKAAANTEDGTEMQRVHSLLSQVHRRNKNQHRGQRWWKFLNLLRRKVGVLVKSEMELREVGKAWQHEGSEGVRKRLARETELGRRKADVEGYVRDVLLTRCYLAFSAVVQDSQFAALGVMLLGTLASVGKEVGLPKVEVEKIMGISLRQTGVDRGEVVAREYSSPKPGGEDDVGEVLDRSAVLKERVRGDEDVESVEMQVESQGAVLAPARKEKKKKGKKSAIDDLFAGLV